MDISIIKWDDCSNCGLATFQVEINDCFNAQLVLVDPDDTCCGDTCGPHEGKMKARCITNTLDPQTTTITNNVSLSLSLPAHTELVNARCQVDNIHAQTFVLNPNASNNQIDISSGEAGVSCVDLDEPEVQSVNISTEYLNITMSPLDGSLSSHSEALGMISPDYTDMILRGSLLTMSTVTSTLSSSGDTVDLDADDADVSMSFWTDDANAIDTACCCSLLPATMYFQLPTDACGNVLYVLGWDADSDKWVYFQDNGGGNSLELDLWCNAGNWQLDVITINGGPPTTSSYFILPGSTCCAGCINLLFGIDTTLICAGDTLSSRCWISGCPILGPTLD